MLSSTKVLPGVYNVCGMAKRPPRLQPRETLIDNLRFLMRQEKLSEDALGKRAGLSQKAINNILNGKSAPSIDTLDKIAVAFGLQGWHLIVPNLPTELLNSPSIEKLYRSFATASPEGRELIERVAEREAQYGSKK